MSEQQPPEPAAEAEPVAGVELQAQLLPNTPPAGHGHRGRPIRRALRAAACVGADYSNMALLDAVGQSLRLFHGTFLAPEIADRYTDVPLSAPRAIAAAARSGKAASCFRISASYGSQFPEILADADRRRHLQAAASVHFHREAALWLVRSASRGPSRHVRRKAGNHRFDAVADLSTATLERAERYDAEHRLIVELTRSLLGKHSGHGGCPVSAGCYLPASRDPLRSKTTRCQRPSPRWREDHAGRRRRDRARRCCRGRHGPDTRHGHHAPPFRRPRSQCVQRGVRHVAPTSRVSSRNSCARGSRRCR